MNGWSLLAILSSAAGMASKEIMVVGPLLVMLYHWMFLQRQPDKRRGWFFLYAGLIATWAVLPIELRGADMDSKSGYGLKYVSRVDYLATQAGVIYHYLQLTYWPRGLVIDYFDWPILHKIGPALEPGLLLTALLILTVVACWKRWWPGFLGAWFFLILAPTSSFLPNFTEVVAERRMYLPVLSLIVLTLAVFFDQVRHAAARAIVVVLIAVTLSALTIARNYQYRSALAIWSDAVAKRPANARAHVYLGNIHVIASEWDAARSEDEIALKLSPHFLPALKLRDMLRFAPPPSATRPGTPVSPAGRPGG